jgi:hypothetical protein
MILWVSINFKVFAHPTLFVKVSVERKEHIKSAIKELTNPFLDSNENKTKLKGTRIVAYHLRVATIEFSIKLINKRRKYRFSIF